MKRSETKKTITTFIGTVLATVIGGSILRAISNADLLTVFIILGGIIGIIAFIVGLYYKFIKEVDYLDYTWNGIIGGFLGLVILIPIMTIINLILNTIVGVFYLQYLHKIYEIIKENKSPQELKSLKESIIDEMRHSLEKIFTPPSKKQVDDDSISEQLGERVRDTFGKKGQLFPALIIVLIIIIAIIIFLLIRKKFS